MLLAWLVRPGAQFDGSIWSFPCGRTPKVMKVCTIAISHIVEPASQLVSLQCISQDIQKSSWPDN